MLYYRFNVFDNLELYIKPEGDMINRCSKYFYLTHMVKRREGEELIIEIIVDFRTERVPGTPYTKRVNILEEVPLLPLSKKVDDKDQIDKIKEILRVDLDLACSLVEEILKTN